MIFAGIKILNWFKDNRASNNIREDIRDTISIDENIDTIDKYNIDFDSLKQKNSDTIAWLKVNGTNIEYPVVKTTNNDYYLTHSFDKSNNSAGWVFMDYIDKFDGTDNEFQEFIDTIKSRSIKDFGVQVDTNDHILTLSTCADNNKYRVVLHAKI